MTSLPPIKILPGGRVVAGDFVLEPADARFRKRRTWWRARLDGKLVSGWCFSPSLALAEAARKSAART